MSIIYPIAAAILQASSYTLDKFALNIKKVTHKVYMGISFPLIFLFTSIIFFFFAPDITANYFTTKNILLIVAVSVLSIFSNLIFYRALKSDLLSEIQTIGLLGRVPLIAFAAILFIDERNLFTIFFATVASLAVIWSHWEKHHFHIAKKTWPYLIWTLIVAPFGGIIHKEILLIWDPITLQLVANSVLALFFTPFYFKHIGKTPKKALPFLIFTNVFTTIAWILFFFGYKFLGIIQTTLIFTLQPLLVYIFSIFFLKEKINSKKLAAFIIILMSIAIANLI